MRGSAGGSSAAQELRGLLARYAPEKLANVPSLLHRYRNREHELLAKVRAKYRTAATRGCLSTTDAAALPPRPPRAKARTKAAAEARKKRATKARYQLQELLQKERTYIGHLAAVKRHWIAPLRKLRDESSASASGASRDGAARVLALVFGNWEALHSLHAQHISALERALLTVPATEDDARFAVFAPSDDDLRDRLGAPWPFGDAPRGVVRRDGARSWALDLAAVFKTLGPMLKLYTPYCTLYATSVGSGDVTSTGQLQADAVLCEAERGGGALGAVLAAAAGAAAPLSLASLRIVPVQRVCRYRLVLVDILKTLRRADDGKVAVAALTDVVATLEASLADVNAAASAAEEAQLLREWQRWSPRSAPTLAGAVAAAQLRRGLIDPARRLLCHGRLHLTAPINIVRPPPDFADGRPNVLLSSVFTGGDIGSVANSTAAAAAAAAVGEVSDGGGFWLAPDGGRIISPHDATHALSAYSYTGTCVHPFFLTNAAVYDKLAYLRTYSSSRVQGFL